MRALLLRLLRGVVARARGRRRRAADSFNGRIAFSSVRTDPQAKEFDIFSMNADGSDVRRLTTNPETDRQPDWSPRRHEHRLRDRQARLAGELRGRADDGGGHGPSSGSR